MKDTDRQSSDVYSSLDDAAKKLYKEEENKAYFDIVSLVKDLEIEGVHQDPHDKSSKFNPIFNFVVSTTRYWLQAKARNYVHEPDEFPKGIDEIIMQDPLTELAYFQKWKGIYKSNKYTEEEQRKYEKFSTAWKAEKKQKFTELVRKYREQVPKPTRQKSLLRYLGTRAAVLAVIGIGLFLGYEHYFKPDLRSEARQMKNEARTEIKKEVKNIKKEVKTEIKDYFSKMPTLDDVVAKIKPEIRSELERYNNQSAENIENAITTTLVKYGKGSQIFEALFPQLKKILQEEIEKDLKKKKKSD